MNDRNGEASTGQGRGSEKFINSLKHKDKAFTVLSDLYLQENFRKFPSLPFRCVPKWNDQTTNGLTRCILDFLKLSGHHSERTGNEGRIIDNRQTFVDVIGRSRTIGSIQRVRSSGMKGTSDIKAIINGQFVAIEIKCSATHDRQRPDQAVYQQKIESAGGLYVIATSFPQFFQWYGSKFGR